MGNLPRNVLNKSARQQIVNSISLFQSQLQNPGWDKKVAPDHVVDQVVKVVPVIKVPPVQSVPMVQVVHKVDLVCPVRPVPLVIQHHHELKAPKVSKVNLVPLVIPVTPVVTVFKVPKVHKVSPVSKVFLVNRDSLASVVTLVKKVQS